MIDDTTFHLTILRPRTMHFDDSYRTLSTHGRYWADLAARFDANDFTARRGEWTTPWPMEQEPTYAMPDYDPGFKKSFVQVSDERALALRDLVRGSDRKLALYYSGGIDSTVAAVALLKNLSTEELKNVAICTSVEGVMENPAFYQRHLRGKIRVLDSARTRYDDLIAHGYYAITADTGDAIFGTVYMMQLLFCYREQVERLSGEARERMQKLCDDPTLGEQPYERFADLLISFLSVKKTPELGRWLYEKLVRNIRSCNVPIYSLHDFFWWFIFNVKYMECALRGALFYYRGDDLKAAIQTNIINWFSGADYQRWSMVNNNNGEKIRGSRTTTYKWAARRYIHDYDHNDWYLNFKLKLGSFELLLRSNAQAHDRVFGLDTGYRVHTFADAEVGRQVRRRLQEYTEH